MQIGNQINSEGQLDFYVILPSWSMIKWYPPEHNNCVYNEHWNFANVPDLRLPGCATSLLFYKIFVWHPRLSSRFLSLKWSFHRRNFTINLFLGVFHDGKRQLIPASKIDKDLVFTFQDSTFSLVIPITRRKWLLITLENLTKTEARKTSKPIHHCLPYPVNYFGSVVSSPVVTSRLN